MAACYNQPVSETDCHQHQRPGISAAGASQEKPPQARAADRATQESSSREKGSQPSGAGLNPPNIAASSLTPAF